MLISADLFCCGLVTLIQSLGFGKYLGIRLPVMMGVTFAAVGPMVAMANAQSGPDGARAIFGAIIGAGIISILIAPLVSRMLRFFPPVVTGTIIAVIGISLMRVGVGWALGGPPPLAQNVDVPKLVAMVDGAKAAAAAEAAKLPAGSAAPAPKLNGPIPMTNNPNYGKLDNLAIAGFVLIAILLLVKYARGFVANIAVLLGIILGCAVAVAMGKMSFEKVAKAGWFDVVTPFAFGMPTFDGVMILTMTLVMIVVMIESTGMFLALCRHHRQKDQPAGTRCGFAHRWGRHLAGRDLQHLSVHQLFAECRSGRCNRCQESLGLRRRRGDHDHPRAAAENGGAG